MLTTIFSFVCCYPLLLSDYFNKKLFSHCVCLFVKYRKLPLAQVLTDRLCGWPLYLLTRKRYPRGCPPINSPPTLVLTLGLWIQDSAPVSGYKLDTNLIDRVACLRNTSPRHVSVLTCALRAPCMPHWEATHPAAQDQSALPAMSEYCHCMTRLLNTLDNRWHRMSPPLYLTLSLSLISHVWPSSSLWRGIQWCSHSSVVTRAAGQSTIGSQAAHSSWHRERENVPCSCPWGSLGSATHWYLHPSDPTQPVTCLTIHEALTEGNKFTLQRHRSLVLIPCGYESSTRVCVLVCVYACLYSWTCLCVCVYIVQFTTHSLFSRGKSARSWSLTQTKLLSQITRMSFLNHFTLINIFL